MATDPLEESARLIIEAFGLISRHDTAPDVNQMLAGLPDVGLPLPLVCAYAWAASRVQASQRLARDEIDLIADFSRLSQDEMKTLLAAAPIIQRLRGRRPASSPNYPPAGA